MSPIVAALAENVNKTGSSWQSTRLVPRNPVQSESLLQLIPQNDAHDALSGRGSRMAKMCASRGSISSELLASLGDLR